MKKTLSVLILILALAFGGCAAGSNPLSSNSPPKGETYTPIELTPELEEEYINKYVLLFKTVSFQTWNNPEELESFRFGNFFGMQNAEVAAQYEIKDSPNHEIPEEVFEEFIQKYFNVSTEYLRTNKFYDPDNHIYTGFFKGGGSPVTYRIIEVTQLGDTEKITYECVSIENPQDRSTTILTIEHSSDGFKLIAVEKL